MKLLLPDVTLVMVETREHELARLAVEDCLRVASFGDVLIVTDKPEAFANSGYADPLIGYQSTGIRGMPFTQIPRFHIVPDWPNKLGWSRSWWFDVPPLLRTRQTLNIQWDSWIWEPAMWSSSFLDYDYIGAPWWYKDGKNVGNGGFSMVSARLKRYICDRRDKFPCDTNVDDDLLCRKYRPKLEEAGFMWAPENIAHGFAFECCRPSATSKHFGFHGMFNWPAVLDEDRLSERLEIAMRSPYITKADGYIMRAFCERNPEIVKKLLASNDSQDRSRSELKEKSHG